MRLISLLLLLCATSSEAITLYVAKTGSDTGNDCSVQSAPCWTITHGISQMSSGDRLIIGDGTYAEIIRNMPSGSNGPDGIDRTSDDIYTEIFAENIARVLIDRSAATAWLDMGIEVNGESYVHIDGIQVRGAKDLNDGGTHQTNGPIVVGLGNATSKVKITRCSVYDAPDRLNSAAIVAGSNASYVLFEGNWVWGTGRYKMHSQSADHIVWRRNVARHDWHGDDGDDSWTQQCACFVNYDSTNMLYQNNICIDSGIDDSRINMYGGFWDENNTDTLKHAVYQGNIVLNLKGAHAAHYDRATGNRTFVDNIYWDVPGGYVTYPKTFSDSYVNLTATRDTIGVVYGTYSTAFPASYGIGFGDNETPGGSFTLRDSILYDSNYGAIQNNIDSNYNNLYYNTTNYVDGASAGANDFYTVPQTTGLLYLPRIESDSTLKTAGSSGGQVGAEVMYQYGEPGSLWGEPNYDQLTSNELWPWANESQIKSDFASYNGDGPVGARGFAAGTSIDGSPQSLTKYIWEYLGNQIPGDIYDQPASKKYTFKRR